MIKTVPQKPSIIIILPTPLQTHQNYAVLFVDKESDRFTSIYNNVKEVAQEFLGRVAQCL